VKHVVVLLILFCFPIIASAQNDCPEALIVCGNDSYRGLDATGIGDIQELGPNACFSNENNSLWLKILIKDGGTLGFILTPDSADLVVDFDFWIFGPNVTCGNIGTAIRCSTTNPLQAGLSYNTTGMNATSTDISEGPGPDGDAWVNWFTVQDDETYYLVIDRPVGSSNFSLVWTGTATFHDIPQFLNPNNIPLDMSQCDNDGIDDSSVAFDLTIYEDMFIGNQTPVAITYHLSLNDATVGENAISNPAVFPNTSNPQTIFLRMVNTITGCYSTESFNISIIPPIPVITGEPENLELCDTNGNGIRQFDLSVNDELITNGSDEYIVKYYATQSNALNEVSPLNTLFQNTIPYGPQTIWARVERSDGCVGHSIVSFNISVNPLPTVAVPADYELCDDNTDGIATFDLTTKADEITNGNNDLVVSYYLSESDAELETGAVANPTIFTNTTANTQVIWVRVENIDIECFETTSFNVVINPLPVIDASVDYTECEITPGSGEAVFDLISQDAIITQGSADYIVDYYSTLLKAQNEDQSGLLDSPYTSAATTVYVRVFNPLTGCVSFGELHLQPVTAPVAGTATPLEVCDNEAFPVNQYHGTFDLTPAINQLTGTQSDITISVHITPEDAQNDINGVPGITAYTNSNTDGFQTVYVRLERTGTTCYTIGTIDLIVHPIPAIGVVTDYPLCDVNNPTDETEVFDLTSKDIEVTNGVGGLTVTYHRSQQEAIAGTNAITNPQALQNETLGEQTIWIRLESAFGCFSTDSFQIIVNPLPVIDTNLEPLKACEEIPGQAIFNLNIIDPLVTMNNQGYNVSYYETLSGAETADENMLIASPKQYSSG